MYESHAGVIRQKGHLQAQKEKKNKKKKKKKPYMSSMQGSSITHFFFLKKNEQFVMNKVFFVAQHNNKHEMRWRQNGRLAILQVWQTKKKKEKVKKNILMDAGLTGICTLN